jgi:hypothetical protein
VAVLCELGCGGAPEARGGADERDHAGCFSDRDSGWLAEPEDGLDKPFARAGWQVREHAEDCGP